MDRYASDRPPYDQKVYPVPARAPRRRRDRLPDVSPATIAALGLGAVALGAVAYGVVASRDDTPRPPDDADPRFREGGRWRGDRAVVGKTVLVNRPASELYDYWKDVRNLPHFMENVRKVEVIEEGRRSRWTLKAPAGTEVTATVDLVEDRPNEMLAFRSTDDSQIEARGFVEFREAPAGRGTYVDLEMEYVPPAGALGRMVANLFRRAPQVQARHELKRFKMLMETGEVATSARTRAEKEGD